MQHYIGVGGVARKVNHTYFGVNAVTRKVKRGYIGVNAVARTFFYCQTIAVTSQIVPSSTVSGIPTGTASIQSDGTTLILSLTSARTTRENYDTDRNKFYVYLTGIIKGDNVSIQVENEYPIASTEVIVLHNKTQIKTWSDYGTNTFTFTASATAPIIIGLDDGDYNLRSDTITATISKLTVNGYEMKFVEG